MLQYQLGEHVGLRPLTKTHPGPTNGMQHPWTDGTRLPFYGVVQIPIRVEDVKLEEIFVLSQINKYAILGTSFVARHDCKMDFAEPVVTIGEHELVCTDRFGRLMASHVQTIRRTTLPP